MDMVRIIAKRGDCTRLGGGVNLGIVVIREEDGAGVGSGGKRGLLGAVGISVGVPSIGDGSMGCVPTAGRTIGDICGVLRLSSSERVGPAKGDATMGSCVKVPKVDLTGDSFDKLSLVGLLMITGIPFEAENGVFCQPPSIVGKSSMTTGAGWGTKVVGV